MTNLRSRAAVLVLAALLAGTVAVAATRSIAHAQSPPQVGATVPSLIALSIGTPSGFTRTGVDTYEIRVPVQVTTSVPSVNLSVADGEDLSGPAHGRLRDGASVVSAPLQVAADGGATQPLAAAVDPLLRHWNGPVSLAPATVVVSQRFAAAPKRLDQLQKLILVTVSSQTP